MLLVVVVVVVVAVAALDAALKVLKELEGGWGGGRGASPPDAVAVAAGATLKFQGHVSHSEHREM